MSQVPAVKGGEAFEVGTPHPLFAIRTPYSGYNLGITGAHSAYSYCATPDGKRFLVNASVEDASSPPILVVINWTEQLKK